MILQSQFTRNFSLMDKGDVDLFLGAGASISSGIPTGSDLVWEFKRSIYCSEQNESTEKYKDLSLPSTRKKLQAYFDSKGSYPKQNASNEYSYFFEHCYSDQIARIRFIQGIVANRQPSIGYLCLAEIVFQGRIKNIWTTNFDSLLENAINTLYPINNILICSEANRDSIHHFNPQYPVIGKLHGDFRYDWLKNSEYELQSLETKLKEYASSQMIDKQLVVIGYSGNDESIMNFLENNLDNPSFLSKGLLWAIRKDSYINPRVSSLISKASNTGRNADFIEIDNFDNLMVSIYRISNYHNNIIDQKTDVYKEKTALCFSGQNIDSFIKLNAYKAEALPSCNVFETDITSWSQLRDIIKDTDVLATLYNKHIYSFSSEETLKNVFKSHSLSAITNEMIPESIIYKHDSIYIELIYLLIKKVFLSKGMKSYKRKKVFNPSSLKYDRGYQVYDAVEYSISYIDGTMYLNLLPTVHIMAYSGESLDEDIYKIQVNIFQSVIYNQEYNNKLKFWENLCKDTKRIVFCNDGFTISFFLPAISVGGITRDPNWITMPAYKYDEPIMCFSDTDSTKRTINQLKGLCQYGPIDCSYDKNAHYRTSIQLAVLSPKEDMTRILTHLSKLNTVIPRSSKDLFLPNYEGFEKIYKRPLLIPSVEQKDICIGYNGKNISQNAPIDFLTFLKKAIDYYSEHSMNYDILIIFIPSYFSHFRMAHEISLDFNLHDALKLYATEKGVRLQIIEEKSINGHDMCKVMWGLSTSLYAKATGILWHPESIDNDTAYVGISYAYSEEKKICIGCSQLFDSTGTGIRMILRKVNNPLFVGKNNPFMREDDARIMMTELREQYYKSSPVNTLKRIVIHKTTPFIQPEISGILQAFKGINVELIQIQEYSSWRGIRFGIKADQTADRFAVKRGLTIKISPDSFLLWTHGCIIHPDLAGTLNYYKGSRGIPAPLFIRRFVGNTSGDVLAKEILMLTKMNWNSGDSLYKLLPVTLDFAKVLAKMSKQEEAIFDKAYDFRYFM